MRITPKAGKGFFGFICFTAIVLLGAGCASNTPPPAAQTNVEQGPDGTIAYYVPIQSSEAGAQIEVNGETVGTTPMKLKIFGDRDGSFHNFGSYDFVVRAYPPAGGRAVTKVFRTGALMSAEDRIPEEIFFRFNATTQTNRP
jgi:hypothetical protein